MIEAPELGDPLKGIKSEFKRYRSYQNRKVKVDVHLNDQVMDLEKPLEKRRTEALLKSLETLTEEQKPYACDWVTVNIFTSTYAFQDEINHLMTAAAIWILDQLSDAAVPPAELCKLLPRDRDLLDDLFSVSMLSDESATVTFPDWYRRDYRHKGEDTDEARNLAQILYEATGCLMPRNMHRYDRMMKELGRYGIRQNKAIAMLNCMEALRTSKHRQDALNLEEGFAAQFESNQKSAPKLTPAELEARNQSLEKELRELRSALHNAEKSNSELRKKLSQEKAQSEAEHRELADLREVVFKSDADIVEETAEESGVVFPYTVQKTTVVFGGHDTWVKAIKPLLKGDIKFIPREMKIDVSLVRYADVIWIQTNAIPHRSYYSIVDTARKYHKPIRYFKFASASKCAEQIVENEQ